MGFRGETHGKATAAGDKADGLPAPGSEQELLGASQRQLPRDRIHRKTPNDQ